MFSHHYFLSVAHLFFIIIASVNTKSANKQSANKQSDDWHIVKQYNLSNMQSIRSDWIIGEHRVGWANSERQAYIDSPQTIFIRNQHVILRAFRQNGSYFSARLQSKETFTPTDHVGKRLRVEFKARIPTRSGAWPALWLLGDTAMYGRWPAGGEIDVMEWVHYLRDNIASAFHWRKGTQRLIHFPYKRSQLESEFLTYGVEYSNRAGNEYIQFYVITPDGRMHMTSVKAVKHVWIWDNFKTCKNSYVAEANRCSFLAPFDNRMHLIMNIAVGGFYGDCCGVRPSHYDAFDGRGVEMEVASVVIYAASRH